MVTRSIKSSRGLLGKSKDLIKSKIFLFLSDASSNLEIIFSMSPTFLNNNIKRTPTWQWKRKLIKKKYKWDQSSMVTYTSTTLHRNSIRKANPNCTNDSITLIPIGPVQTTDKVPFREISYILIPSFEELISFIMARMAWPVIIYGPSPWRN